MGAILQKAAPYESRIFHTPHHFIDFGPGLKSSIHGCALPNQGETGKTMAALRDIVSRTRSKTFGCLLKSSSVCSALTVVAASMAILPVADGQASAQQASPTYTAVGSIQTWERDVNLKGRRPSIGIAFEGGGALGLAHVGVMQWMDDHHVPVDRIAGTSMGALVGALFATGATPKEIEGLARGDVFSNLFTLKPSLSQLSYRRREDRTDLPGALTFGLKGGLTLGSGLIADNELNAFLTKQLAAYASTGLNYDDLPIPFRCVSTDLTTLQPKIFSSGSLPFAVRASISIAGVFPPIHLDGHILIDGATVDNLPLDVLRQELRPDVVISVYLGDAPFAEADATSLATVFGRALSAGASRNVALTRPMADIEIAPAVTQLSVTDFAKTDVLIKAGYAAAELQRHKLLRYALSDEAWAAYKAGLASRQRRPPVRIEAVHLDDPNALASKQLVGRVEKLQNKAFSQNQTEALVSDIRGEGALDAYYSTFHTPQAIEARAAESKTIAGDDGIVIHLRPNRDGPPYLLFGTDIAAMNANVTSVLFKARVVGENFGGYGSELRSDLFLGYLTRIGGEYYKPIAASSFFIQPHAQYLREPIYLWVNQKRVSERLFQRAGGGLDIGYTANKNLQLAAVYQASIIRWVLKDGIDYSPTPHASGLAQSVAGHLVFSNRTAEVASPTGSRIDLTAGYLLHSVDSDKAPFLSAKARQAFHLNSDTVTLTASTDTYFRRNVADPLRFTLGGPLRLTGSSVDEFRGTDTVLAQAIVLHRLANLPTGLGHGLFLATGYEAGSIWSPEHRSTLRQDGILGLLVNTPIGVMTVGGSVGDAGHRKVFFTLGRLF